MENDPQHQFQGEMLQSGVVKNDIEPQNWDKNGPLFLGTSEEELKKDKLSNIPDFRALLANFDPTSAPPLTSANELEEYLESSASAVFPAPYFRFLDFNSNNNPNTDEEEEDEPEQKGQVKKSPEETLKKPQEKLEENYQAENENEPEKHGVDCETFRLKQLVVKGREYLRSFLQERFNHFMSRRIWTGLDLIKEPNFEWMAKVRKKIVNVGPVQKWDFNTLYSILTTINLNSEQLEPDEKLKLTKENEQLALFCDVSENILSGLSVTEMRQKFEQVESALVNLGCPPDEIDKIKRLPFSSFSIDAMTFEMEDPNSQLVLLLKDGELALAFSNFSKAIRIYSRALKLPNLTLSQKASLRLKRSQATVELLKCNLNEGQPVDEVNVKGHLRSARKDAEKIAFNQPHSWFVFSELGNIHLFYNQFQSAKLAYESARETLTAYFKKKQGYLEYLWRLLMTHQYCELERRFKAASFDDSKNEVARSLLCHPVKMKLNGETEFSSKSMDRILKRMKTHKSKRVVALEFVYRANSLKFKFESISSANTNANITAIREKEIAELYSKGATRKNPEALYNFAMLHFDGRAVSKDEEKATKLLKELARFSVDKDVEEEKCQFKDIEGVVEFPEPRKIFVAAAMYELGRRSKSEDEKEGWFTKAKENGSALAANDLAILIKSRNGAHRKIDAIIELFRTAAKQGLNLALRNLAWAYLQRYCAFDDKTDVQYAEYCFLKSLEERYQNPDPEFRRENQDFVTSVEKLQVAAEKWQEKYDKFQSKLKSEPSSDSNSNSSENCGKNPKNEELVEKSFLEAYFSAKTQFEAAASSGFEGAQHVVDVMGHLTSGLNRLEKYVQLKLQQTEDENDEDSPVLKTLKMEILHEFAQLFVLGAHLSFFTQEDKENLQTIASEKIGKVDPFSSAENLAIVSSAKIVLEFVQKGSLDGIWEEITSTEAEAKRIFHFEF